MIGHEQGLRVAMIMYEDNARLINETLAALAPKSELHTIALGRIDAMLAIRRWLDEGGVAGVLADRSLPAQSQRSKAIALPFLGAPALFPDGPFRLAAMLRRKVVFMAGLYRGGRDYDLRFVELADFASLTGGGPAAAPSATPRCAPRSSATWRRSRRSAAKRPTTGSTSTTSGLMPTRRRHPSRAERRRFGAAALAGALAAATALAPAPVRAAGFDLEALTALLGRVKSGEATFVETRRIEMLDRTLKSSGRLSFKAPDMFVRETLRPRRELLAVDGNTLTLGLGDRSRTMPLDASPEASVDRRGDSRHAHRRPGDARAPVRDPRLR